MDPAAMVDAAPSAAKKRGRPKKLAKDQMPAERKIELDKLKGRRLAA